MGALASLLRTIITWVAMAAVLLMVGRYIVDVFPNASVFSGLAEWVRRGSQPAISFASEWLKIRPSEGFWNPLPLGIAVAAMIAGGIVSALLDLLFIPDRPKHTPKPENAEDKPTVLPKMAPKAPATASAAPARASAAPPAAAAPTPPQAAAPQPPATAPSEDALATVFVAPAIPPEPQGPKKIGRYEITDELGRGAMGVVYKAKDPQIGRTVAIKTVLISGGSDTAAEEFKKRFFSEARAAGRLNHPGIMKVYDLIEDEYGHPCMVLEFFEGPTLDKLVKNARPSLLESLKIMTQAAQAMAFAHEHKVVHRDIKPGNIMVAPGGHTIIADFGIAKLEDTNMTATGTILGTPAYMSPEQVQGLPVDHRTDIFSLGAVLYWLVTGERPFPGSTFTTIAYNVVHTEPKPISELLKPVPDVLDPVMEKCLAKAPSDRYQSANELAAALREVRL